MATGLKINVHAVFASIMYSCLTASPVSVTASLCAAISDDGGEDRISALSDKLLRNVISRLPVKDGARTDALSRRWRGLWRATPLVLHDAHLLTDGPVHDWRAPAAAAVSRVLASHPGPFRWVHLVSNLIHESNQDALAEWLQLLADKGVENLILVNRPWFSDVPPVQLPESILCCGALLRRLYLGVWFFPVTNDASPPSADVFPHLRELGICKGVMRNRDLEYVLDCSPKLEILALISTYCLPNRVQIGSHSIRCVLLWNSLGVEVTVIDAPQLQRLILDCPHPLRRHGRAINIKVKIGYAPQLTVLGYLDTAKHVLEIGNTIIKARATKVSQHTVVPSIKVLALIARFTVPEDVTTLLSFLRCFPEVETLHVMASDDNTDCYVEVKAKDNLSSTFWQRVSPIECVQSSVKKLVFDRFSGGLNQVKFLKLVLERAVLLNEVIVVLADMDSNAASEAMGRLQPLTSNTRWASMVWHKPSLEIRVYPKGHVWRYSEASDLSTSDPFIS